MRRFLIVLFLVCAISLIWSPLGRAAITPLQNYTIPDNSYIQSGLHYCHGTGYLYITTRANTGGNTRVRYSIWNFTSSTDFTFDTEIFSTRGNDETYCCSGAAPISRPYNNATNPYRVQYKITESCNSDCIRTYNISAQDLQGWWSMRDGAMDKFDLINHTDGVFYRDSTDYLYHFNKSDDSSYNYGKPQNWAGWSYGSDDIDDIKFYDAPNLKGYFLEDQHILEFDLKTQSILAEYDASDFGISGGYRGIAPINKTHVFLKDVDDIILVDLRDGADASSITAVAPINNNSVSESGTQLEVSLSAASGTLNGTLTFYLDGTAIKTTTITDNTTTSHYAATGTLSGEHYNWHAIYVDSIAQEWSTGTQEFKVEYGMADEIGEGVARSFGLKDDAFSTKEEKGIAFLSLILTAMFSFMPVFIIFRFGDSHNVGQVYIVSFIGWLIIFTFIGWLPAWIIAVILVLTGLILAGLSAKHIR